MELDTFTYTSLSITKFYKISKDRRNFFKEYLLVLEKEYVILHKFDLLRIREISNSFSFLNRGRFLY